MTSGSLDRDDRTLSESLRYVAAHKRNKTGRHSHREMNRGVAEAERQPAPGRCGCSRRPGRRSRSAEPARSTFTVEARAYDLELTRRIVGQSRGRPPGPNRSRMYPTSAGLNAELG